MKQFIPCNIVESLISDLQRWWTVKTELQSVITESAFKCPHDPRHVCDNTNATLVHLYFLGVKLLLNQLESACQKAQHW